MTEPSYRSAAQEIGEVIRRLEQVRQEAVRLQGNMAGLDTRLRLLAEGVAAAADPARPSLPSDGPVIWLSGLWQGVVAAVNAQANANRPADAAAAASTAVLDRFESTHLEPLRQLMVNVVPELTVLRLEMGEAGEWRSVGERYAAARSLAERLEALLREARTGAGSTSAWSGALDLPPLEGAALVAPGDGVNRLPQVRLAPLLEHLEAEANRQIARHFAPADSRMPADPAALLKSALMELLESWLGLKYSVAQQLERARQVGADTLEAGNAIVRIIDRTLRTVGLDEIETAPGDRVNNRVHRVEAWEPNAKLDSNAVVRVITPGYRFEGQIHPARVVAKP